MTKLTKWEFRKLKIAVRAAQKAIDADPKKWAGCTASWDRTGKPNCWAAVILDANDGVIAYAAKNGDVEFADTGEAA